jgi:16S rRNA (adenine1518-N6/adenine1519-N6)-dimethyltransferase
MAGVRPDKALGQNFLIDEDTIDTIVSESGVSKETLVIEIGPGTGALTLPLAEAAGRVIAVELDEDMIKGLRIKTFDLDNVEIIHQDILETDIKSLASEAMAEHGLKELRIIGNLPYYITTPIIMKLLETDTGATSITVMMQKEVADRIAAEPGTRASGAITYPVHYHARVSEIASVPRECFYPAPKVDSAVLRLDLRDEPAVSVKDEDLMMRCIKAGFSMRRKTLLNSLTALGYQNKEILSEALISAGIDPTRRAETLTLEEFARLSDNLQEA